jgi:hypothetical protein
MLFRAALAGSLILAAPVLAASILAGPALAAERPSAARPKTCAHHGPGFAPIPGTDTCVRVSGRVRSEVDVGSARSIGGYGGGGSARLNAEARAALDARTETDAGPLRTVVRVRARRGEPSPR